ncbi:unnamed protein product [Amoebophrya sp. A120]|nr:unnamed protein product [Amoebophrya sp. A120]|eukprot:GSA120T00007866001.1
MTTMEFAAGKGLRKSRSCSTGSIARSFKVVFSLLLKGLLMVSELHHVMVRRAKALVPTQNKQDDLQENMASSKSTRQQHDRFSLRPRWMKTRGNLRVLPHEDTSANYNQPQQQPIFVGVLQDDDERSSSPQNNPKNMRQVPLDPLPPAVSRTSNFLQAAKLKLRSTLFVNVFYYIANPKETDQTSRLLPVFPLLVETWLVHFRATSSTTFIGKNTVINIEPRLTLVTDENVRSFLPDMPAEFDRLPDPHSKSDLIRYGLLYTHGGIYLGTDFVFQRDVHPNILRSLARGGSSAEEERRANNADGEDRGATDVKNSTEHIPSIELFSYENDRQNCRGGASSTTTSENESQMNHETVVYRQLASTVSYSMFRHPLCFAQQRRWLRGSPVYLSFALPFWRPERFSGGLGIFGIGRVGPSSVRRDG